MHLDRVPFVALPAVVALVLAPAPAGAGAVLAERLPFGVPRTTPLPPFSGRLVLQPDRKGWLVTVPGGSRAGLLGLLLAAGGRAVAPEIGVWRVADAALPRFRLVLRRRGIEPAVEPDRIVRLATAPAPVPGIDPFSQDARWDLVDARGLVPPDPSGAYRASWVIDSGIASSRLFDVVDPATYSSVGPQDPEPTGVPGGGEGFHGASVASLMAAPSNGVGIEGIWPSMRIASYDISGAREGELLESRIIAGLVAAGRARAPVVNLSFASASPLAAEERAVAYAQGRGAVIVAAAGNVGDTINDVEYPAAYPHVLAVGALAADGSFAPYSNHHPYVDVTAPGDIVATVPAGYDPGGCLSLGTDGAPSWCALRGTSFATPVVSAIASWVAVARPRLTTIQRGNLLRASARDIGAPGKDPFAGYGAVDLRRALDTSAFPSSRVADDPLEPNEDVSIVAAGDSGSRPFLLPRSRRRRTLDASVDAVKDPVDVYRVQTRPGERIVVTLRPGAGDVNLFAWSGRTISVGWLGRARPKSALLGSSRSRGRRVDALQLLTATHGVLYLAVEIPRGSPGGAYALTIRRQSLAPGGRSATNPTGRRGTGPPD